MTGTRERTRESDKIASVSKYPFFLRTSLLCTYIEVEGLSEFEAIKKTGIERARTLVIIMTGTREHRGKR